jgi:hypothetical protein
MLRDIPIQRDRTECRDDTRGFGLILDDDGNTMERAHERPAARKDIVEPIRFGKGVLVYVHYRIERRSFPVVRFDTIEVTLNELPAREAPMAKGLMDVRNRRFFELECFISHVAWP